MEETQNNRIVGVSSDSSEETFEAKVIRNVRQGGFAVYKTPEVVGGTTMIANIEWENPDEVDKFFSFAKSLAAKVIYVTESEEEDEESHQMKTTIIQVGFIYESIMHHINLEEEEDDEEDEYEEEDSEEGEYEEDTDEEDVESNTQEDSEENQTSSNTQKQPHQQLQGFTEPTQEQSSNQEQTPKSQPTENVAPQNTNSAPWPKPQF